MVNWEFFDNQTPESAKDLVDRLRSGNPPTPSRGADHLCTWKEASRVLAGFSDGRATEGANAGPATLVGLTIAKERGWSVSEPAPNEPSSITSPRGVTAGNDNRPADARSLGSLG